MKEHEYILENHLVNHVYKDMLPFGDFLTVYDEYIMMVIHYALITMHLIGLAGFHKGMNVELAIKLIQSFAKMVEHNKLYLKEAHDLLLKYGYCYENRDTVKGQGEMAIQHLNPPTSAMEQSIQPHMGGNINIRV